MSRHKNKIEIIKEDYNIENISSNIINETLQFDIRELRSENYFKLLIKNYNKQGAVLINNITGILMEDIIIVSSIRGRIYSFLITQDKNYVGSIIFPLVSNEEIGIGVKETIIEGIVNFKYQIIYFN